jgi:cob(I)alamin adenosyltransferase
MKIYTKQGDKGMTGLFGGTRVPKSNIRIESYGTIDELNSWLGLLRDQQIDEAYIEALTGIQKNLFVVGALLATEPPSARPGQGKSKDSGIRDIGEAEIRFLETEMDAMNQNLPRMTHFILPGGNPVVSYCHIARTVCRRAERLIVQLHEKEPVNTNVLIYINRLSDYLFVLARSLSGQLGADEIKWVPEPNT